ncbi:hypothetical protein PF005_g613 [Phytophthora fragariae]|uniref:PH domain-containing protein n=1 Tax=Phytophthora fragariae TaxID=53985 RepID=A0A6A3TPT3_9STRA|nr:hypothetical protein PF003_g32801 [Phytophthora fragariae]KAE8949608.1 hypothetical protein PF009_g840 [Phytophthora fragariae]KAE9030776.1 hypothetical protein PF011_g452 [Phytophthora fragariae]KAE9139388.1 hypothetical protein PF010_g588 [Phytophthora fragariae]KAE9140297.1 hypothetical protein PF007_g700 [Phytophthora fragariae]
MQPWAGGRRERERSSSVVLLGKISAIVRRGSLFQADPEDARGSSSSGGSCGDKDDDATAPPSRHARRSSIAGTPTQSGMTLWDPRASGSGARAQRFQFYPTRTLVAAALARPLSPEEVARRGELEAQIGDFAAMHACFAPAVLLPDEQEEKEEVEMEEEEEQGDEQEEEEEQGDEQEEEEMDNNQQETLEEEERRAALDTEEDVAIEAVERISGAFADDEELLDFDPMNMPMSVRTLMNRIKSESLLSESEAPVTAAVSNQDEENDDDESDEDDEDVDQIDDVEELHLDNNNAERDDERSSVEEEEAIAHIEQELVQELSPVEHRLLQRRRTRLLSCAAERAALTAQDQLTSSVRRLVIQLKDDSDQLRQPLTQSHGIRCKSRTIPTRRRAGSCPNSHDLGLDAFLSPQDVLPLSAPTAISPALIPQEVHPGKKQKKSAFSRLGPRVLETLHLRKKRKTYLFTDEELETIEGARWKIVELAFRFGGKHRSYLVQAINMFFPLLKYGRRGGAHATRLHCNCCGTLQWQHKRGGLSEAVDLAEVLQVLDGRRTAVFRKYASNRILEACSFSLVFRGRTLDLETQSSSHRDWLVSALRTLVAYARRQRRMEQQAIAERAILPLEDELRPEQTSPTQTSLPRTAQNTRRLDDSAMMAAIPPNYKIRTVY